MPVYVDDLTDYPPDTISAEAIKHGARWCHLVADSLDELHQFARNIGCKREWFQEHHRLPHYDLTPHMRKVAIKYGAVEITSKGLVNLMHRWDSDKLARAFDHVPPASEIRFTLKEVTEGDEKDHFAAESTGVLSLVFNNKADAETTEVRLIIEHMVDLGFTVSATCQ
jgi:hypothetical protein